MSQALPLIVHPVHDVAAATALYRTLLGVEPYVDSPYYVGFRVGDQELGLDPNGHAAGLTAPVAYWQVDDITARVADLVAAGAQIQEDVKDVGGGKLRVWLRDADGNLFGLLQG